MICGRIPVGRPVWDPVSRITRSFGGGRAVIVQTYSRLSNSADVCTRNLRKLGIITRSKTVFGTETSCTFRKRLELGVESPGSRSPVVGALP